MRGITGKAFRTASDAAVSVKELRGRAPAAQVAALDRRHPTHDYSEVDREVARDKLLAALSEVNRVTLPTKSSTEVILPIDTVSVLLDLAELIGDQTDAEVLAVRQAHRIVRAGRAVRYARRSE